VNQDLTSICTIVKASDESELLREMPRSLLIAPEADSKTLQTWVSKAGLMEKLLANILNAGI
jgi:hypothetical protein